MLKGVPVLNGLYIAGSSYVYWLPVCLDLSKQRLVKAFLSSKQDFILEIKYINIKKKIGRKNTLMAGVAWHVWWLAFSVGAA